MDRTVMVVVGTRPEAIKMAPVYRALASSPLRPVLVTTGQHREMVDDALASLELRADIDLGAMPSGQSLPGILAMVIERSGRAFVGAMPLAVLVQGDTTSVLACALSAYQLRIPVGHVEAGLRTHDHDHPFPEEANRQVVARLARWSFAPTENAAENLRREGISDDRILVTGNTAVDALLWAAGRTGSRLEPNTLLLTLHRRESFGEALRAIVTGVRDFLQSVPDARVVWPVHPNPAVRQAAVELGQTDRVRLIDPVPYRDFAGLMATSRAILTDSGGIQEEAPSLGKHVLIAREATERPEGLRAGTSTLVGRTRESVASGLLAAWRREPYDGPLPAPNPFGDGRAAHRIIAALEGALSS